jgi:5-methylcytosine-specific restriction protein A
MKLKLKNTLELLVMKNPKWHRKELILALDLYFKLELGHINSWNKEIL